MLRTIFGFILLFFPLICLSAETTTSGSVFIRRKSPSSRMGGGGGRLSLMNNRFNKRPKKKHLDPDQLLDILGSFYDPLWMSIEEPTPLVNKDPDRGATYVYREWQQAELIKQLQLSNLSQELAQANIREIPGLVKTVEKWMMKKASCPIRYAWEDIGALFWPRYIRRGECVRATCSWPPGMHCVPSGTTTLHLLRWQCKVPKGRRKNLKNNNKEQLKNKDQNINLKCSWIRVPYPITNDCLCTC
ncbi:noggin-1 [Parasteatoda tepidariorum]|uniref:noggin-1 n=1 Tax=Parasteatoda tepidariorum TaxID=114398 RepID=UPI001C718E41|nr:noggin-1 [Parasteatoda tepidariorum]